MAGSKTDFNDLHVERGLAAVKAQLLAALEGRQGVPVSEQPPAFDDVPAEAYEQDAARADGGEGSPSPSTDAGGGVVDESGRYSVSTLLDQFWYVWGTDTAWDNINRRQIRLSHLRHGVGRERYKMWDESFARRWVKDIRFEPGVDLGDEYVNLYDGFEMEPAKLDPLTADLLPEAGCQRILDHVRMLCGDRYDVYLWLLKWIALPLQKPGTKMDSSVIMYGNEGPGKSVLWERVVKKIYGKYGVTIGQAQLDSQFTGWRSCKLFALAEEVVSRSERNHHKGMLKQIVTGATHMINEKMLPEHEERNCMNFVFLSNSTIPLELDMGDRRYLVLYVNRSLDKSYFDALFDEINRGGVEHFYRYLLEMNLDGFDAHTRPPETAEKSELIGVSLPAPVYFHQLWKSGELGLPYVSATAGDLFLAFKRWCDDNNEFKRTERYFGSELKRVMAQERHNIQYPDCFSGRVTKRIYVTEEDLARRSEPGYVDLLSESCRVFARELKDSFGV